MAKGATGDAFWFDDWRILFDSGRLTEFFPTASMSLAEKLNAIVRFGLYAGALLFMFNTNYTAVYLPIALLVVSKVLYDRNKPAEGYLNGLVADGDNELPNQNPRVLNKDGQLCVPPTADNPFMNVTMSDYKLDPERPAACAITEPSVREDANAKFYDNLFRDVNDVYSRNTSSRQFYTMPATTIPNNQDEFAQFLYGDMGKCKTGHLDQCMYDDPRMNRRPVNDDPTQKQYE